jgi:hypothetical protein
MAGNIHYSPALFLSGACSKDTIIGLFPKLFMDIFHI